MFATVLSLQAESSLFVVNSNSQNLSKIDLANYEVENNFAGLGQFPSTAPNKAAVYDEHIYVVITYENVVQKLSVHDGSHVGYIYMEDSAMPNDILIHGNYAYVSGNVTYRVYKIDLETDEVVGSVDVGKAPQGMTIVEEKLLVANTGFDLSNYTYDPGTISVLDIADFTVIDTLDTAINPAVMEMIDDKLHVVCSGDYVSEFGVVQIFSADNLAFEFSIEIGGSPASIAKGTDDLVYLANSWPAGIYAYDAYSYEIVITPDDEIYYPGNVVNTFANYLAIGDAKDFVQNSTVYLYDMLENTFIDSFEVGVGLTDLKFYEETTSATPNEFEKFSLANVYPNPVNFSENDLKISYSLAQPARIEISIFNLKGQKVQSILKDHHNRGEFMINWDGRDKNSMSLSSGIYLWKVENGSRYQTGKVIIIK
jgi:hypothetical protein